MSTELTGAFDVQLTDDGGIKITGEWAAHILMRIVLSAKFQTELSAEMLLSPHVRRLVDELLRVVPYHPDHWNDAGTITAPAFLEVVEVVKEFRMLHAPEAILEDLVRDALHPHAVPLSRLGLGG